MYRKLMLQVKGSYRGLMQDGDHTDGHCITMFAEQLTRTFEVLVHSHLLYSEWTFLLMFNKNTYTIKIRRLMNNHELFLALPLTTFFGTLPFEMPPFFLNLTSPLESFKPLRLSTSFFFSLLLK